ncbi:SRPBCC family protein [Roseateles sp. P5_E7]
MPREIKVVSETVAASANEVYEFARQRENLHRWASGLASADIAEEGDHWVVADSPMGRIQIRMAPKNEFGVLDHEVTTPDGMTTHNAFRVTPVDEGCALTFVVLRAAGASDEAFEQDAAHVLKDLRALKVLVEGGSDEPLPFGPG